MATDVHRLMKTISAGLQHSSIYKGALCPLVVEKEIHVTWFLAFPEPSYSPRKTKQGQPLLFTLLYISNL